VTPVRTAVSIVVRAEAPSGHGFVCYSRRAEALSLA
jgi:hypothetical protein